MGKIDASRQCNIFGPRLHFLKELSRADFVMKVIIPETTGVTGIRKTF